MSSITPQVCLLRKRGYLISPPFPVILRYAQSLPSSTTIIIRLSIWNETTDTTYTSPPVPMSSLVRLSNIIEIVSTYSWQSSVRPSPKPTTQLEKRRLIACYGKRRQRTCSRTKPPPRTLCKTTIWHNRAERWSTNATLVSPKLLKTPAIVTEEP